jgi:hypothetical protein
MREGWALLHQVITEESEATTLRIDSGFVVYRAVLETELQLARHPVTTGDLGQVAVGEDVALQRAEYEKAVDYALRVAYGYRRRRQRARLEQRSAAQASSTASGLEQTPSSIGLFYFQHHVRTRPRYPSPALRLTSSNSVSVPDDHINSPAVPRPHCQQITGVVCAASWRRVIREGIFHDYPFPIQAVGTENVSLQKPVSFAL